MLDEPTAVLTAQEVTDLIAVLNRLKAGRHRRSCSSATSSNEVLRVADRITVLRRGKKIGTVPRAGRHRAEPGPHGGRPRRASVGGEGSRASPTEPILAVEELEVRDDRDLEAVNGMSLTRPRRRDRRDRRGRWQRPERAGRGDHRAARAGSRAGSSSAAATSPARASRRPPTAGVAHIAEDRQRRGLVLPFTLAENLALREFRRPDISKGGWLRVKHMRSARARPAQGVRRARRQLRLATPHRCRAATSRRWRSRARSRRTRKLLIAHQPTRGLDVGAIEFVHKRLIEERDKGRAILLVSLEYEEVRSLADRILVICGGQIMGEFPPDASEEELGIAMTGGQSDPPEPRAPPERPREHARRGDPGRGPSGRGGQRRRADDAGTAHGLRPRRQGRDRADPDDADRVRRRRPRRAADRPQPVLDLQGDLQGHRPEVDIPVGHRGRADDGGVQPAADADLRPRR